MGWIDWVVGLRLGPVDAVDCEIAILDHIVDLGSLVLVVGENILQPFVTKKPDIDAGAVTHPNLKGFGGEGVVVLTDDAGRKTDAFRARLTQWNVVSKIAALIQW